ncbi:unnamed protein product [Vitrella brassicaformis CCMP3155]|uniref:EF-hand domain-containing protein n=2 Tax=Vitrella brassicaformis TaxID=1169539 RepID=A0A0G4GCC8_VITBC|nr:unnamed protein product [Vitrella brassicaformis CCMP3155]|mmetsp:Transcript_46953/g.117060  ORF Transcript_46953/g.117060 Transcript_46953/m.117060 type:complete len:571 (+) Transcript_46953:108-1820(+)|eukprot:CEM26913.1 unnamed protein product [Vitrella brassicaformis CCMP3155]
MGYVERLAAAAQPLPGEEKRTLEQAESECRKIFEELQLKQQQQKQQRQGSTGTDPHGSDAHSAFDRLARTQGLHPAAKGSPLAQLLLEGSREAFLETLRVSLPTQADLKAIADVMVQYCDPRGEMGRVNHEGFEKVRTLLPEAFHHFFTPKVFAKLKRDEYGCISVEELTYHIYQTTSILRSRIRLEPYDGDGDGYLTHNEFAAFIKGWMDESKSKSIRTIRANPTDRHLFVEYVVTVFFFDLDPRRRRRISIADIVHHDTWMELQQTMGGDDRAGCESLGVRQWQTTMEAFAAVRSPTHDGHLNLDKFMDFLHDASPRFARRAFEVYANEGEISVYQTVVCLLLVYARDYTNRSMVMQESTVCWIFRAMDIYGTGRITSSVVEYFYLPTLRAYYGRTGLSHSEYRALLDELMDMVKGRRSSAPPPSALLQHEEDMSFTMQDIKRSKLGYAALKNVIDMVAYDRHNLREQRLSTEASRPRETHDHVDDEHHHNHNPHQQQPQQHSPPPPHNGDGADQPQEADLRGLGVRSGGCLRHPGDADATTEYHESVREGDDNSSSVSVSSLAAEMH